MGANGYPRPQGELIQMPTEEHTLSPNVPDMIDGNRGSLFSQDAINYVMGDGNHSYTVPAVIRVGDPERGGTTDMWLVRGTLKPGITSMGHDVTYGMVGGKRQIISGSTYALVDPINLRIGTGGIVESGFFPIGGEHSEIIGRGAQSSSDLVTRSNDLLGPGFSRHHLEVQVIRGDQLLVTNLGSKNPTRVITMGEAERPGSNGLLARFTAWTGRIGLGPRR